jgi:hypothetical protein
MAAQNSMSWLSASDREENRRSVTGARRAALMAAIIAPMSLGHELGVNWKFGRTWWA